VALLMCLAAAAAVVSWLYGLDLDTLYGPGPRLPFSVDDVSTRRRQRVEPAERPSCVS